MPKQLNISLQFDANTDRAKAAINDLMKSLQKISTISPKSSQIFDTKQIREASQAARELQQHLSAAVDVNTGKLNLSQFSASLKKSNTTLQTYQKRLEALGPEGEKAFQKVATNIANAENPLRRTNQHLAQFATTLKNTARWQISSSILHGFMGSIQTAYRYAQDLNGSLNNIRIVTGMSADEMSIFAEQANKAAQALSTTTTQYTDAALIYYQQGIRDQDEIAGRVETTIKLANVSRQSAQEVSDEMTAIWNNFYDGSKSLEYYADVITALGAATASSSEEISTGLQKFAAVADTVGLSYEYATSALATITATTRQSAETVGTGLRTLFSRLQGLKLGETLEDGVDLNKYSKALESVGVQILDVTGEMKDMDTILNELGDRWGALSDAQQTALAQTVGGVRQYTNLIALMDNWDFMKENLTVAKGAEGTLQEQANIYAESWEAAQKRVKAALENIYSQLLNDDFFIDLTNALATTLKGVSGLIDGLGGVQGILLSVGSIFMQHYAREMPAALDNIKSSLLNIATIEQQNAQNIQAQNVQLNQSRANEQFGLMAVSVDEGSMELAAQQELTAKIGQERLKLNEIEHTLSASEKARAELNIQFLEEEREALMALGKQYDETNAKIQNKAAELDKVFGNTATDVFQAGKNKGVFEEISKELKTYGKALNDSGTSVENFKTKLERMQKIAMGASTEEIKDRWDQFGKKLEAINPTADNAREKLLALEQEVRKLAGDSVVNASDAFNTAKTSMEQAGDGSKKAADDIKRLSEEAERLGYRMIKTTGQISNAGETIRSVDKHVATMSEVFVSFSASLMQVTALINAATRIKDVFSDKDATTIQKLGAVIGGLTALIMTFNAVVKLSNTLQANAIMLGKVNAAVKTLEGTAIGKVVIAQLNAIATTLGLETAMAPLLVVTLALVAAMAALALIIWGVTTAVQAISNAYNKDAIAAENAEKASHNLTEALKETQQAYDDLKSSIENYQSAYNAIDTLQRGTEEWKNAIRQSNIEALKLIDSLKLLRDADYTIDKDGIIRIDEDTLNKALEEKGQAVDSAQSRSLMMNQTAKQNRAQSNLTDLKRSNNTEADGLIDYAVKRLTSGDLADAFRKNNLTDEELKQQLYIEDDDLIQSIKDLATTINQNTDMQKMTAEEIARIAVNNNNKLSDSKNREDVVKIAGKVYDQTYGKKYAEYLEKAQDRGLFGTGTKDAKEAMAAYAKELGLDQLNGYQVENYKRNGSVEYSYIDESGERQKKEATAEEIAAAWAVADANNELAQSTIDVALQLGKIERMGGATSDALKDFITNENFYGSTKSNIEAIQKVGDASKYLGNIIGDSNGTLTNEEAQALGFESAKAMVDSFEKGVEQAKQDWESLDLESIGISGQEWAQGLSLETAKALQDTFATISLGPAGKEAGKSFIQGINTLLKDVSKDDQQTALNQLMQIDWSSWDALDQAKNIMSELGYEIDTSSEYWQNFATEMRTATNAKQDFNDLKNILNDISKILQSLDFGKVISDEDYQKLVAYNDEWERFFQLQADGTRKFIGDSKQMRDSMQDDLKSQIQTARESQKIQEGVNDSWAGSTNFEAMNGKNTHMAEKLAGASGPVEDMLEQLGYSDEIIEKLIQDVSTGAEGAEDRMKEMYSRIAEFQSENFETMDQEFQEMLSSTATNVAQLQDMLQEGYIGIDDYSKGLSSMAMNTSLNAPDLTSLQNGIQALGGSTTFGEGDNTYYDEYAQGLQRIASEYESCSEAAANYQYALTALEEATNENREALTQNVEKAEKHLEVMVSCEEAAEKYGLESKTLAAQMKEIANAEGETEEQALAMAIANERMNKGVSKLNKSWSDWKKTLKSTEKTSEDYADTLVEVSEAVTDLVGWYKDLNLDSKFVTKNMGLIDKAAEGDVTSILELGAAVSQLEIAESELNTTIAEGAMTDGGQNAFQEWSNSALSAQENFDNLKGTLGDTFGLIQSKMGELQGGASLQDILGGPGGVEAFVSQLNAYAAATGMTASQMQSMLSSIGVTANVESDYQEQDITVPTYREEVTAVNYKQLTGQVQMEDGTTQDRTTIIPEYTKASVPGPPLKTKGFVEVASISMEDNGGNPTPPVFSGRQAPSSSATSGGGGGGRRGGGGGGSAPRMNSEAKKPRDKGERYHVIRNQLETVEKQLNKVSTAYERAFGRAKVKLLDQQIAKQKELIDKQRKYKNEIEDFYKEDTKNLTKVGKKEFWSETDKQLVKTDVSAEKYLGMNVKFDKNGDILNYDDLIKKNLQMYNAAVEEFNKHDTEDEGAKRAFELAQARYDGFLEMLEQYEETHDLLLDEQQKLIEEQNKYYDQLLERTTLVVDIKIAVNDDALEQLEFLLERIDADAFNAAERIKLIGDEADESLSKIDTYRSGLTEIFSNHGINGAKALRDLQNDNITPDELLEKMQKKDNTLTEKEVETMREYMSNLLEESSKLAEYRVKVIEDIGTVLDASIEKIETLNKKMEHLKNIANSYKNIVDLTGRDYLKINSELYDQMEATNVALAEQSLEMSKAEMDNAISMRDQMIAAHNARKNMLSEEEEYAWQQELQKAEEYVQEATENYYSSWEEAIEAVSTRFESAMKNMAEDFSKAMSGAVGSLEGLAERMDLRKKVASTFVPEYEKIYQLTKLTREAQKQIDSSNNIKVQRELQKVQEKILAARQDGQKISQYEIDYLQKELELKAAQMAMEEAARVKSQVRMSRDSEGNYSYVYTADEKAVADAEANYADKLYEMQKLNEEYIDDLQGKMVDLQQSYIEAMQNAKDIYGMGTEEYYKAIREIDAEYNQYFNDLTAEMNLALSNQQEVATIHADTYRQITGDIWQANVDLTTSWHETTLAALTEFDTIEEYESAWSKAHSDVLETSKTAMDTWKEKIDSAFKKAGTSVTQFQSDVKKAVGDKETKDSILYKANQVKNDFDKTLTFVQNKFKKTLKEVKDFEKEYSKKIQKIINKNTKLTDSLKKAIAEWSKLNDQDKDKNKDKDDKPKDDKPTNNGGGDKNHTPKVGDVATYTGGSYYASSYGDGPTGNRGPGKKVKITYLNDGAPYPIHVESNDSAYGWLKKSQLKFKTGGYTGDWAGTEGRTAILHQKELVLNADDTKNMLAVVGMVRDIVSAIDTNALYAGSGFAGVSAPGVKTASSVLDQQVHITAEFPNATNRQEILAAFDNIINLASQYANR